jgi:hypothetical protein
MQRDAEFGDSSSNSGHRGADELRPTIVVPETATRSKAARAAQLSVVLVAAGTGDVLDRDQQRQCANHLACATQRDASLAAEIGAGWAVFVRGQIALRKPWPAFQGRCAAIALRLVAGLADNDERRLDLARICWWRAGLRWEALESGRSRDRPYETPDGRGLIYPLGGALCVHFRTRRARAVRFTAADAPWSKGRAGGSR